jgi:SAM-dependent methyltransferase
MAVFKNYSKYYDAIYRDKDYLKETRFILKVLKRYGLKRWNLLSLGCGTCTYEILLAKKGYKIVGIDKSETMLKIASKKIEGAKLGSKIHILKRDVRNFSFNKKFDNAMAMFNIVGYQTKNRDFEKMLANVSHSLKKFGIFIFDCWYMPAVLKDGPTRKIKKIKTKKGFVTRLTKSQLLVNRNIIEINFEVTENVKSKIVRRVNETHKMRYWSLPELEYFLDKTGFILERVCNFMNLNSEISDNKWNIFVVARKR